MAGCDAAGGVGVVGVFAHAAANATPTTTLTTADANADIDVFSTHFGRATLPAYQQELAQLADDLRSGAPGRGVITFA